MPQSGVTGRFTVSVDGLLRLRHEVDLGRFGQMRSGLDGDRGWAEERPDQFKEVTGDRLAQLRISGPLAQAGDWFDFFETARILGTESRDRRELAKIQLTPASGLPVTVLVDLESGDTVEERGAIPLPGGLGSVPIVTRYADWRDVDGARLPFRVTTEQSESGRTISVTEEIETGLEFEEGHFTIPR